MRSLTRQELQDLIDGGNDFTQAIATQCLAAEQATERAMRYAFEAGYGSGHNDTVEGMFSLDEETMSEEWLADIKSDGTFKAILNRSKS